MWFFDSVLEETPEKMISRKNSEQDGSFLIIDESITANTLPDTAVQLFDEKSNSSTIAEIAFFDNETVIPVDTESPEDILDALPNAPAEVVFFTEETEVQTDDIVIVEEKTKNEDMMSFMDEPQIIIDEKIIPVVSGPIVSNADTIYAKEDLVQFPHDTAKTTPLETKDIVVFPALPLEKNDIYAPILEAIAQYDRILATHTKIAETKDKEIADFNSRIADAKAGAKKALEERKVLEAEMDRVKQMKDLFALQLKQK